MYKTRFARKLDSTGRLVIPTKLREQMGLVVGEEYIFYITEDEEGSKYICIKCPAIDEKTVEEARKIIEQWEKQNKNK